MKKLTAVLRGCKFEDTLIELREKEIRRRFEAAKDECKEAHILAKMKYNEAIQALAADKADYTTIIQKMVEAKSFILQADKTLEILTEIESDLDGNINSEASHNE